MIRTYIRIQSCICRRREFSTKSREHPSSDPADGPLRPGCPCREACSVRELVARRALVLRALEPQRQKQRQHGSNEKESIRYRQTLQSCHERVQYLPCCRTRPGVASAAELRRLLLAAVKWYMATREFDNGKDFPSIFINVQVLYPLFLLLYYWMDCFDYLGRGPGGGAKSAVLLIALCLIMKTGISVEESVEVNHNKTAVN